MITQPQPQPQPNGAEDKFLIKLKLLFPHLTKRDLVHCKQAIYNNSTKEAALEMQMSIKGVESARRRIRKKLSISKKMSLPIFLLDRLQTPL